ncbi:MAG TPA: ABC transporter substrate-binding protein [Arenibaculum sp.]|nr:ABC transporter substrate-binding protein [Arenibaculum sp.]
MAATMAPAQAEIQVGVGTALTGPFAAFGDEVRNGVEAAVEAINADGGINGEEIVLQFADDACDPKQGMAAANQLVNQGIKYVIGHLCTGPSVPASDLYAEEDVIMITSTATAPVVTERGLDNVFRVAGRDDQQAAVAADYIAQEYPDARIAVVHDKQSYGQGLAEATAQALRDKGIEIAVQESVTAGESDFSALVTKLKNEGIGVLYYGGYHGEAGQIVRQMRAADLDTVLIGADGLNNTDFWNITGDAGEGTLFTFAPDPANNPASAQVVEQLEAENIDPAFFTLYSYAAMQVLAEALKQAESLETPDVIDALREGTFDTVVGTIDFDDKGDLTDPAYVVYAWQDGGFEEITPAN